MAADESPILSSFHHHQVPKLEDFLGDSSSIVRYSDNSQTETQDSSLTHLTQIYDHHNVGAAAYFNDHQDLKAITGFQAFSTNSGSEVDDSASMGRTQLAAVEFPGHSNCPTAGSLSLGVNQTSEINNTTTTNKAVVPVDSNCSKKIVDTFGQRTSIYRGVTRYKHHLTIFFPRNFFFFLMGVTYMAMVNTDTDGRVDTKLIYGITAVGEKVKLGKGVKVHKYIHIWLYIHCLTVKRNLHAFK